MNPIDILLWILVIIAAPFALYALCYVAAMLFALLVLLWAIIKQLLEG